MIGRERERERGRQGGREKESGKEGGREGERERERGMARCSKESLQHELTCKGSPLFMAASASLHIRDNSCLCSLVGNRF